MSSARIYPNERLIGAFIKRLSIGFEFRVTATGKSMEPTIRPGDIVFVKRARIEMVGAGTVVAFIQPRSSFLVLHRVVERRTVEGSVKLQTKGDANSWIDPWWISNNNFLGIAKGVARNGQKEALPLCLYQKIGLHVFFNKLLYVLSTFFKRLSVESSKFFR